MQFTIEIVFIYNFERILSLQSKEINIFWNSSYNNFTLSMKKIGNTLKQYTIAIIQEPSVSGHFDGPYKTKLDVDWLVG